MLPLCCLCHWAAQPPALDPVLCQLAPILSSFLLLANSLAFSSPGFLLGEEKTEQVTKTLHPSAPASIASVKFHNPLWPRRPKLTELD